jgi:hypothetical protein
LGKEIKVFLVATKIMNGVAGRMEEMTKAKWMKLQKGVSTENC